MSDLDPTPGASTPQSPEPPSWGSDADAPAPTPWTDPVGAPPAAPPSEPEWPQAWPESPPTTYRASDWGLPPIAPTPLPDQSGFLPKLPPPPPQVRWGLGDVFYGVLVWIVSSLVATVVLFATGMLDVNTDTGDVGEMGLATLALSMAAGWVGLVGWPLIATYVKGLRSLAKDFGFTIVWGDVGWGVVGGISALAISVVGNIVWTALSDAPEPSNGDFLPTSHATAASGVVLFLLIAVCTPIAEELFFRGLFLRSATKKWNTLVGMLLSSVVFGAFHLTEFSLSGVFICLVTASYGLVLATLVVFRNFRIGPSIVAHGVINGVAVIAALAVGG